MIEDLARLKPWVIVAAGGLATLIGLLVVAGLSHLGYTLFPEAWGWVAVFHIGGSAAALLYISKPFIEAYSLRHFMDSWRDINLFEEKK